MKQNNTNKTFKTELEKLKQMSIEDRLWYIWEYYKLQIFAFFLVIFLLYEAGTCIYRNLQDTMLYCVTVNETSLLSSDFSIVQKEFEEKNGFDKTWKENTIFDCSLSVDDSNKEVYDQYYNTASNIKLTSLDLSSFLSEDLYEKLEKENRLLTAVDGGGNKICTGISLDDSYLSSKLPLSDESSLSVCTDKNHPDVVQDFITYCIWGK